MLIGMTGFAQILVQRLLHELLVVHECPLLQPLMLLYLYSCEVYDLGFVANSLLVNACDNKLTEDDVAYIVDFSMSVFLKPEYLKHMHRSIWTSAGWRSSHAINC